MKNRLVRQLLTHPVRTLKTLMLVTALAGSVTACSMQFSGTGEALPDLADDPSIQSIYEGLGEAISEADFTDEADLAQLSAALRGAAQATEHIGDVEFEQATLMRVVDGDTIVVRMDNADYKVRLIGINTPESVAPETYRVGNSKEGLEASNLVKAMLSDVTTVYLQKDVSDTDRYDRLLRYVWLELPEDPYDYEEVSQKMLNAVLVIGGIAEAVEYEPDTAYSAYFEEMER